MESNDKVPELHKSDSVVLEPSDAPEDNNSLYLAILLMVPFWSPLIYGALLISGDFLTSHIFGRRLYALAPEHTIMWGLLVFQGVLWFLSFSYKARPYFVAIPLVWIGMYFAMQLIGNTTASAFFSVLEKRAGKHN